MARESLRRLRRGGDEITRGDFPWVFTKARGRAESTRDWSRQLATKTFGEAPSHGTPAGLAVAAAAERVITPNTCEHLRTRGYAVVDGAMDGIDVDGVPLAEAMLNELRSLSSSPGVLTRNATVRSARGGERYVREKFSWRTRAKHAPYDARRARENRKVRNFLGPDKG